MKKTLKKSKSFLVMLWTTIISTPFKVIGQELESFKQYWKDDFGFEPMYWIENYHPGIYEPSEPSVIIATIIKIAPRLLVVITFIVWIVSFIKIKKLDDKTLKKKKIIKTVIIVSILIILIIALFFTPLLIRYFS